MAFFSKLFIVMIFMVSNGIATRDFKPAHPAYNNIASRIEANGSLVECWTALLELKSCSNEIVLFFLNGERTEIGVECCAAIGTITHDCWPAMLTSIGFTAEEGNIKRGYCDASAPAVAPVLAPAVAPSVMMGVEN